MLRRSALVFPLVALTSLAAANAAMGIGMEMWPLPIWGAYCIAMVVVEAIFIGRKLGFPWLSSFGISLGANFATAWVCAVGGCAAPFLHSSFVGTPINPNPFWNAVVLLLILAIPSAFLESIVWRLCLRKYGEIREWPIVGRTFLVHLACVPLGMAILLIPARPYRVTEGFAEYRRRMVLLHLMRSLDHNPDVPPLQADLYKWAQSVPGSDLKEGDWAAFYEPDFERFDTGEARRVPLEANVSLIGVRLLKQNGDWAVQPTWLIRTRPSERAWPYGIVMSEDGTYRYSHDWGELGWKNHAK